MLDVEETATPTAISPDILARTPPQLREYVWPPGVSGNPKGRPLGAKARVLVEKSETQLAKKYVKRALDDANPNQDANLRHAMDKFLPDAGRTDTLLSVSLTRSDVLAELRRRGIAAPFDETP